MTRSVYCEGRSVTTARTPTDGRPERAGGRRAGAPAASVPEGAPALPGPSRPGSPSPRWNAPGGEWNDAGAAGSRGANGMPTM